MVWLAQGDQVGGEVAASTAAAHYVVWVSHGEQPAYLAAGELGCHAHDNSTFTLRPWAMSSTIATASSESKSSEEDAP